MISPMPLAGASQIPVAEVPVRAFIYRCYDAADRLMYVGRSTNPEQRWDWHRHNTIWPYLITRREVSGPMSPGEAKAEELRVIRSERPRLNITGNPDYIDLSRKDRTLRYWAQLDEAHDHLLARKRAA